MGFFLTWEVGKWWRCRWFPSPWLPLFIVEVNNIPSKEHKYVNLRGGIYPLLTYVFMTGCGYGYCPGRSQYRRHLIMVKTVKCMDCCIFLTHSIKKTKTRQTYYAYSIFWNNMKSLMFTDYIWLAPRLARGFRYFHIATGTGESPGNPGSDFLCRASAQIHYATVSCRKMFQPKKQLGTSMWNHVGLSILCSKNSKDGSFMQF